ncbi:MAG: methylmalonyl Co-A mutase-associated GTPase MeaB [Anaerolineae bacterium]|nr:methylmalonyl Co-A mutase-associated GTPase MeaB [Anaerolineae bacterium]NUQ04651.1 methylmalonyl Co-A mutase-associated GTPase MeaB [Anaerolineae bacterium]
MTVQVEAILRGERRAVARLLTSVENGREGVDETLAALFPHTGRAWVIGVTGSPGTGKSTLVNALTQAYRRQGHQVGILAVDPTSPFTGGAILGDRIRMRDLAGDVGVFIRSMATRGSLGGLSKATRDAARVLDAAGFDIILIETVGAGQNEVDIVRAAHTTLVVEAPGMGDEVQAIKAGILEIADVLVVNKADRPGAAQTVRALRTMLELGHPTRQAGMVGHHGRLMAVETQPTADNGMWLPPIVETVASDNQGMDVLITAIGQHRQFLSQGERRSALEQGQFSIEIQERLRDTLMERLLRQLPADALDGMTGRIQSREIDPQGAVETLLSQIIFTPLAP